MTRMAELAADAKAVLGEGPSWDAAKHVLYWVDIEGCAVHEFHPGTGENRTINVGQRIGAVVPSASGRLHGRDAARFLPVKHG